MVAKYPLLHNPCAVAGADIQISPKGTAGAPHPPSTRGTPADGLWMPLLACIVPLSWCTSPFSMPPPHHCRAPALTDHLDGITESCRRRFWGMPSLQMLRIGGHIVERRSPKSCGGLSSFMLNPNGFPGWAARLPPSSIAPLPPPVAEGWQLTAQRMKLLKRLTLQCVGLGDGETKVWRGLQPCKQRLQHKDPHKTKANTGPEPWTLPQTFCRSVIARSSSDALQKLSVATSAKQCRRLLLRCQLLPRLLRSAADIMDLVLLPLLLCFGPFSAGYGVCPSPCPESCPAPVPTRCVRTTSWGINQ